MMQQATDDGRSINNLQNCAISLILKIEKSEMYAS